MKMIFYGIMAETDEERLFLRSVDCLFVKYREPQTETDRQRQTTDRQTTDRQQTDRQGD